MRMPPTQVEFIGFQGGLDQITPTLMMQPGACRSAQNFEVDTFGGYRRTDGYERFDGRVSPSDAIHYVLPVTFSAAVSIGNTITGGTSAATGVVIAVGSDFIVFTKKTGDFVAAESVLVSAVPVATTTDVAQTSGGATQELRAIYQSKAADAYRTDIAAVPGSGQIRGLKFFGDVLYAMRDNAGATACVVHKSTVSGWQAVNLGEEIAFTNANVDVGEDDILTQGGVTATIERVIVQSGSLASGINTGRLILSARAGGNFAAGAATSTGGGTLTLGGAQTAITLLAGGRFRFVTYNFGAGLRVYGCDGKNRAFEFDGTVMAPIVTGMPSDAPSHIAAHKNHLFLAFDNSLQHSAIGNPYNWTPLLGAGELNAGDRITNLLPMPGDAVAGGALACFSRHSARMLYGNSSADWQLVTFRSDSGAWPHTAQFVDQGYVLDDRGVTSMASTQAFGNFASGALSQGINKLLSEVRGRAIDSTVAREKNQYRILFIGGHVLTMTLQGDRVAGFMPLRLGHSMVLMEASETSLGEEVLFYGGPDGFVYQSGKGTSFDGQPIESLLELAFNHSKSPRLLKQYRKVVFEVAGSGYAQFAFSADLSYASEEVPQIEQKSVSFNDAQLGSGQWDASSWDIGTWDGVTLLPAEQPIAGVAQNMAMRIAQISNYYAPITLSGALLHFTPRRQLR